MQLYSTGAISNTDLIILNVAWQFSVQINFFFWSSPLNDAALWQSCGRFYGSSILAAIPRNLMKFYLSLDTGYWWISSTLTTTGATWPSPTIHSHARKTTCTWQNLLFPSLLLAEHPAVDTVGNGDVQCTGPNSHCTFKVIYV